MIGLRQHLISLCLMSGLCLAFFYVSQQQMNSPWMQLAFNPEINDMLLESMIDLRTLSKLDPEQAEIYRERFESTRDVVANLEIIYTRREKIEQSYRLLLVSLFGGSLLVLVLTQIWRLRHQDLRLFKLNTYLERLAAGDPDVTVDETKRDLIGNIARMIQDTSRTMAGHQHRLKYLENLERWQESSRRLAHEIRTPLTAIRLELNKLVKDNRFSTEEREPLYDYRQSIIEEIDRLREFTDQFTAFAKVREPKLKSEPLADFIAEFLELYEEAWPNLELQFQADINPEVLMERKMIRQIIVNLCNNSAKALGEREGHISFQINRDDRGVQLTLADDGPGIPAELRARIFEPYTTTKAAGEGMGLGLAISRKIMLDHGGDLELVSTSTQGAAFALNFPIASQPTREGETARSEA